MTVFRDTFSRIGKDIRRIPLALAVLILYGAVTQLVFHTVCPFAIIMGFPCPGCGLTHAGFSLLCGQFTAAARWNAAIYLWGPFLIYLCFFRYVLGRRIPAVLPLTILVCLATVIYYVVRWRTGTLISVPCKGLFPALSQFFLVLYN